MRWPSLLSMTPNLSVARILLCLTEYVLYHCIQFFMILRCTVPKFSRKARPFFPLYAILCCSLDSCVLRLLLCRSCCCSGSCGRCIGCRKSGCSTKSGCGKLLSSKRSIGVAKVTACKKVELDEEEGTDKNMHRDNTNRE